MFNMDPTRLAPAALEGISLTRSLRHARRWQDGLSSLAVLSLLLLVIHPEYRAFLLVLDVVGFDLFLILVAIQLRLLLQPAALRLLMAEGYARLCAMSRLPCWMPPRATLAQRPDWLLQALPIDTLVLGACAGASVLALCVQPLVPWARPAAALGLYAVLQPLLLAPVWLRGPRCADARA